MFRGNNLFSNFVKNAHKRFSHARAYFSLANKWPLREPFIKKKKYINQNDVACRSIFLYVLINILLFHKKLTFNSNNTVAKIVVNADQRLINF